MEIIWRGTRVDQSVNFSEMRGGVKIKVTWEHFPCFFKREGTIIMDARVAHEEENIFEYVF